MSAPQEKKDNANGNIEVIDLGKRSSKSIKKLKRSSGKTYSAVSKWAGDREVEVLVLIVERKKKKGGKGSGFRIPTPFDFFC